MLSVGVSTYKYRRQEDCLEFAHQDAIDFTKAMLRQKGKLYQDVISSELPNEQATREQVIEGFEWLRQNTTVNDVAMIFMAGHGLNDKWGGYLFLPYDFREEKAATTVSQSELAYYLKNIYGKALFFLDTCHAGALAGAFRGARDIDINGLVNDLKSAENGMIVFASCAGKERSMESSTWQHGAFTKALLEGLDGRCKNGKNITHMALGRYITDRVKELTNGAQHVIFVMLKPVEDFPVAAV